MNKTVQDLDLDETDEPRCAACLTTSDMYPSLYKDLCVECFGDAGGNVGNPRPLSKKKLLEFWGRKMSEWREPEDRARAQQKFNEIREKMTR